MPENKNLIVAAIDVGSSSIRMDVAEIHDGGSFRILETLSKGISLGKDTFTNGQLSEETIQTACQALIDFQKIMNSYSVAKYRAVATGAVRESINSDTFLDRAFLRSAIEIEVIDGSEENRLMYLAIHDAISGIEELRNKNALVVEVGGGNTDISLLKDGELVDSAIYPLGSIRLRQDLMRVQGDLKQRIRVLDRQVKNAINSITLNLPLSEVQEIIALGGDVRFAARQIVGPDTGTYWTIGKKDFVKFVNDAARNGIDDLVRLYSISYPQAETLVPALLGYKNIMESTKSERLFVLKASIRAGVLLDMAGREFGRGLESFERQVLASARAMAEKYHCNREHVEQVRELSLTIFDQLQSEHGLERRERLLLEVAALLHDVGSFISNRAHHKHTGYIISSSQLFGLAQSEMNIVANVGRYHRKSMPKSAHIPYMSLDRESRMVVSKLAAILRVADALDQDHNRKLQLTRIVPDDENNRYLLEVQADGDLTIERLSLERKSDLFKAIFGKPLILSQLEKTE